MNNMRPRTLSGLLVGPTGNMQGAYTVFDLNTGKVKIPENFTQVPMPDRIIKVPNVWGEIYKKRRKDKQE